MAILTGDEFVDSLDRRGHSRARRTVRAAADCWALPEEPRIFRE